MKFFKRNIPLNTLIPVEVDGYSISQLDIMDALLRIRLKQDVRSELRKLNFMGTDASLESWSGGTKSYQGSWPKRFKKWAFKSSGVKLTDSEVADMGEVIHSGVKGLQSGLSIEFTDHSNWKAGEYGDGNSCWFPGGAHNGTRLELIDAGGGAIRFYDGDQKRGRLWYYPVDGGDNLVIFNIYDKRDVMTLLGISRILNAMYDVRYARALELRFPNAYINGETAMLVGLSATARVVSLNFKLKKLEVPDSVFGPDTTFTRQPQKNNKCLSCLADVLEGTVFCEECYDDHGFSCEECGDVDHVDNSYSGLDGELLCSDCWSEKYFNCYECDNTRINQECTYIERYDRNVCDDCIDRHYFYCGECGEYSKDIEDKYNDEHICNTCADSWYRCEKCDRFDDEDNAERAYSDDNKNDYVMLCRNHKDLAVHCDYCDDDFYPAHYECPNAPEEEEEEE